MTKCKVAIAMSGGVDSAVAAALLIKQGYDVFGVTLQLYAPEDGQGQSTCCSLDDVHDAKILCADLGIKHYVVDYQKEFRKEVIEPFVKDYKAGLTPVPCINCNKTVKFRDLIKFAKSIGADFLATGHYIRKIKKDNINELHTGIDSGKDQSYFMHSMTQDMLDMSMFPLGQFTKPQVREMASDMNIFVKSKKDSQNICFVPDGNYVKFLESQTVIDKKAGDIVLNGRGDILGRHNGLINYTIGQRKGIGVSYSKPLFVIKRDYKSNTLYVGPESDLYSESFIVSEVSSIVEDISGFDNISVCLRALQCKINCSIKEVNGKFFVTLKSPGRAVTLGQYAVFYQGTRVLGGGKITALIGE